MSDKEKKSKIRSYKLVLLGESGTGKTSYVFFGVGLTVEDWLLDFIVMNSMNYKDTAGQERFRSLIPMYYRQASSAIIVFDITKPSTYQAATKWVKETKRQSENKNIVIALVGNKSDLESQRGIDPQVPSKYARENGIIYQETSAKSGNNVSGLFKAVAEKLLDTQDSWIEKEQTDQSQYFSRVYDLTNDDPEDESKCPC